MADCQHQWKMCQIQFGFIIFEKCLQTGLVRTHFSYDEVSEEYREGDYTWNTVECVQSFRFNLCCPECGRQEDFSDLMGLLYCTSCLDDCKVEMLRKELEPERTWLLVAFGFLPKGPQGGLPKPKLDILTDYFNQRRDTSRSKIRIVSYDLIENNLSVCKGEFIHDRGSPFGGTTRYQQAAIVSWQPVVTFDGLGVD